MLCKPDASGRYFIFTPLKIHREHFQVPQTVPLKLFSLNDYMGLSTHPQVRLAAVKAAASAGMGRQMALISNILSLFSALWISRGQTTP